MSNRENTESFAPHILKTREKLLERLNVLWVRLFMHEHTVYEVENCEKLLQQATDRFDTLLLKVKNTQIESDIKDYLKSASEISYYENCITTREWCEKNLQKIKDDFNDFPLEENSWKAQIISDLKTIISDGRANTLEEALNLL